jgi:hypothetical protein
MLLSKEHPSSIEILSSRSIRSIVLDCHVDDVQVSVSCGKAHPTSVPVDGHIILNNGILHTCVIIIRHYFQSATVLIMDVVINVALVKRNVVVRTEHND